MAGSIVPALFAPVAQGGPSAAFISPAAFKALVIVGLMSNVDDAGVRALSAFQNRCPALSHPFRVSDSPQTLRRATVALPIVSVRHCIDADIGLIARKTKEFFAM